MEVGSVAAYARSIQEETAEAQKYLQQLKGKMVAANVSMVVYRNVCCINVIIYTLNVLFFHSYGSRGSRLTNNDDTRRESTRREISGTTNTENERFGCKKFGQPFILIDLVFKTRIPALINKKLMKFYNLKYSKSLRLFHSGYFCSSFYLCYLYFMFFLISHLLWCLTKKTRIFHFFLIIPLGISIFDSNDKCKLVNILPCLWWL